MTTQQLQDIDAFRNEVRQAEFTLFDLRAKLRLVEATHKRPDTAGKIAEFGRLLEKAMSSLEQVIDESETLIRKKNSSHAQRPA